MNQRLVYVAGGVLAAALIGFAIWRGGQAPPPVSGTPPPVTGTGEAPVVHDETASVPRIEPDELLAHFKAGDVTIIDVRDADSFLSAHIPHALHIPLARVQGEVPYLPKGKPIVAYCT